MPTHYRRPHHREIVEFYAVYGASYLPPLTSRQLAARRRREEDEAMAMGGDATGLSPAAFSAPQGDDAEHFFARNNPISISF